MQSFCSWPKLKKIRSKGFTLMEVMIALSILTLIGGLSFATLSRAMNSKEKAYALTSRYNLVRQGMLRMAREISMAFISLHKDCDDPRMLSGFIGKRASNGMRLDFSSFSHYKMKLDANESDQEEVGYFIANDKEHAGKQVLMRRQKSRLNDRFGEGGKEQVLLEDAVDLEFSFYDDKSDRWLDEWDTTGIDFKKRLPKFVSIKLKVKDANDKEELFVTKTRIFVTKAISIMGTSYIECVD